MTASGKTDTALRAESAALRKRIRTLENSVREGRRTEEALRESENKLQTIYDTVGAGILIIDRDTQVIVEANQKAIEMTGLARERLIGQVCHSLVCPAEVGRCPVKDLGQQIDHSERKLIHANGHRSDILKTVSTITLKGRPCYLESFIDITDQKEAEASLRENQAIFDAFLEHSPVYVFFKDERIRSVRLSRNYETMLGRPLNELLGKTMDELFPSAMAKGMVADDLRILEEGKAIQVEEEFDGRVYRTTKFPIRHEGRPAYLAGYTIDITERRRIEEEKRRLEERLNRAEKMEALGTMAGGIAHDLNNVLGIVVGYSELLLAEVADPGRLRSGLQNILNSGVKAAAIVQDLLTLARRGVYGRSVLNLNQIVAETLQSPEFEKLAYYYPRAEIRTELDPELMNLSGSSVHLGKMLLNLLANAAEAMPQGGILTIRTANQYLDRPIRGYDDVWEGDYVVLAVADNGEGIPAADLKRIFEPFYTKKVMGRSGTGLGLAVVWGTVKDHEGYIDVHSEVGCGSLFTLYFPVTQEPLTLEAATVPMAEYLGKGETVLVVDDVAGQRELAGEILKRLNYQVAAVAGGKEAIEYLLNHEADLLILDMIMDPGMDGLETYRRILEIRPQQRAIIVSGFSETERVAKAQALGAGAYLKKPYIQEKLGLAVRRELDR